MGAVDHTKSGIASGVVNSSRQVGGALGIAVLGAIAAVLATNSWSDTISSLPPAAHARAEAATPIVLGGQGSVVAAASGSQALGNAALQAFMDGVQGAMLAGSVLAFCAAAAAYFGLRGMPKPQPPGAGAEAEPPVPVEV
jgi:DHA2 family multidrug resistance protein-like MFS transporter